MTSIVLDVSNQRTVTLKQVRDSKCVALIAKATEGSSFRDKVLAVHRRIAKEAGIPFGSYLFVHPHSPGNEAEFYLHFAKPKPGDLQPIIDAEVQDGSTFLQVAARVDACAQRLEMHGYRPILYASTSFWKQLFAADPKLKRLRVWQAQYPGRFSKWWPWLAVYRTKLLHGVTVCLWQFTDAYLVDGQRFDASVLYGSLDALTIPEPPV